MIREDFTVEPASWQNDEAALRTVREQVFVIEQAIPVDDEWDALDERSHHALARDADGRPIATGRLVPPAAARGDATPGLGAHAQSASIGRMAVLAEWRGRGVGDAIMRVLLEQARALRYPTIELHAQSHAAAFYAKFGFEAYGEEFDECAIPHRCMRLTIASGASREFAPLPPKPEPQLLVAGDRAQALAATAALLADARHTLAIYTRDLDPALLDVPASLDAIKRVALSGRAATVRVLVHEPRKALVEGHRLIALAQRLPSTIALRTPVDDRDRQYAGAFLLNDRRGYLFRPLATRPDGEGSTYAPGRHAQLLALFDEIWERSAPCEDLRPLGF